MKKTLFIILSSILLLSCLTYKNPVTVCENSDLKFLKKIAINYAPHDSSMPNSFCFHKPPAVLTKAQSDTMSCLAAKKDKEVEKYLTLIYLKLYNANLEHCLSSWYIDKKSQYFWAFRKYFTPKFNQEHLREVYLNSFGYFWVKENPELLNFKPISVQFTIIENRLAEIESNWNKQNEKNKKPLTPK